MSPSCVGFHFDRTAPLAFDHDKVKQISLDNDVFLVSSLFEPCGSTQMEFVSSTTPPVVRWAGGSVDTVKPHTQKGMTGFGFDGATREEILQNLITGTRDSKEVYDQHTGQLQEIRENDFKQRFCGKMRPPGISVVCTSLLWRTNSTVSLLSLTSFPPLEGHAIDSSRSLGLGPHPSEAQ